MKRGRETAPLHIAKWFQRAREDAGLDQERAAALLGISATHLSRYENGRVPIPLEKQRAMQALYGVGAPADAHEPVPGPRPGASAPRATGGHPPFAYTDPRYWSARWDQAVISLRTVLREHEQLADEMRDVVWAHARESALASPSAVTPTPDVAGIALESLPLAPPDPNEEDGGAAERRGHG